MNRIISVTIGTIIAVCLIIAFLLAVICLPFVLIYKLIIKNLGIFERIVNKQISALESGKTKNKGKDERN